MIVLILVLVAVGAGAQWLSRGLGSWLRRGRSLVTALLVRVSAVSYLAAGAVLGRTGLDEWVRDHSWSWVTTVLTLAGLVAAVLLFVTFLPYQVIAKEPSDSLCIAGVVMPVLCAQAAALSIGGLVGDALRLTAQGIADLSNAAAGVLIGA